MPPIHLSSTFAFEGFGTPRKFDYTRSGNPTRSQLADALAELEGGAGAVVTSTGLSAVTLVLQLLNRAATRSSRRTIAMAARSGCCVRCAKRGYFDVVFADLTDPRERRGDRRARAAARVGGDAEQSAAAHHGHSRDRRSVRTRRGSLVVVDNTFLSPALQQPISLGADIVRALDDEVPQRA